LKPLMSQRSVASPSSPVSPLPMPVSSMSQSSRGLFYQNNSVKKFSSKMSVRRGRKDNTSDTDLSPMSPFSRLVSVPAPAMPQLSMDPFYQKDGAKKSVSSKKSAHKGYGDSDMDLGYRDDVRQEVSLLMLEKFRKYHLTFDVATAHFICFR
jgi:hypothetical protein